MNSPAALLARLDAIGRSLEQSGHALALLGLGSVGLELDRLDAYSDLDFFAVVADGCKARYLDNLDWLSGVCPVAYHFRNTRHGYKLLFADGIFCEFAVFELPELRATPFARGRLVWQRAGFDASQLEPAPAAPAAPPPVEALVGEALSNLYVGLGRLRRGEALAAERLIQHYALDRLLELAPMLEPEAPAHRDRFAGERRVEQRFPRLAQQLPRFVQGYARSREAALAILDFLEQHFAVNPAMAAAIRRLADDPA